MADTRTSFESQASLSLKAKVPLRPVAAMASTPEPTTTPMFTAKNDTGKEPEKPDYITGLKLHIVLFGLTLVGFVIMLDQTIVATVRGTFDFHLLLLTISRLSHVSPTHSIQSKILAGTDQHTCSHCNTSFPFLLLLY